MGRVGSVAAPANQGSGMDSGADGETSQLFHAVGVAADAEVQAHEHRSVALRRTLRHRSEARARQHQLSEEEWSTGRLTAREGTTVEMACL